LTEDKDVAGGVPSLDTNRKVPVNELYEATTSSKGITQLTDGVTSVSTSTAATPNSVKTAYDRAVSAGNDVKTHNSSSTAHTDIRNLISALTTRLNTLADSDDTTLDQLSEIVAYIKNNKSLIDGITTSKINVSDIIDNLTSSVTNKPLSAKQGKVLNDLITALTTTVGNKVDKVSGKGLSSNDYTAEEKNKLNGISSGAEVNQNAFSNIVVGSTTIEADTKTDTLTIVPGNNITLTPDATNDKLTITAKNTTYSTGTSSVSGVTKLYTGTGTATDGTMTQAAIKSALDGKANSSHGNHVPTTQTANNKIFLRNDNTWQTITPANIGAAASSHTHNYALPSHTHSLLHSDLGVIVANTTTDNGWSMINDTYNGHILKSIRFQQNAPAWAYGNFASGIAFGGSDTHGVISVPYNTPGLRVAGGNGTKPAWYFSMTGTPYNLSNFPTKTGEGATGTWNINVSGNAATATKTHTTLLTEPTTETQYYMLFAEYVSGNRDLYTNSGLKYFTNAKSTDILELGFSSIVASDNRIGKLRLINGLETTTIESTQSTNKVVITLPNISGTIALTSHSHDNIRQVLTVTSGKTITISCPIMGIGSGG